MHEYIFIYKDSLGHFNEATSPRFIASHTQCRAIEKSTILQSFDLIADFIYALNYEKDSFKVLDIVQSTSLEEIF